MSQDSIIQILHTAGVKGITGFGDVYRGVCPFHEGSSGKTFWLHLDSMSWGCWSTRCPQHSGGDLKKLLHASGMSWAQASMRVKSVDGYNSSRIGLTKDSLSNQSDLDASGILRGSHLSAWSVDWHLADQIYSALSSSQEVPKSIRDTRAYKHITALSYPLFRGLRPEALMTMSVGFDPDSDSLIFPLLNFEGELVGVSRRRPKPNESYYISGSPYPKNHARYTYRRVPKGDCLWGWYELRDRIAAGEDIIVVEGYADQLNLLGYGYCAVAKLGSKLTAAQVRVLSSVSNRIYLWPDKDRAGIQGAAEDATRLLCLPNARAVVPVCSDPADTPRDLATKAIQESINCAEYLSAVPNLMFAP